MKRAYLDWAAGAPLHPVARDAVSEVLGLGAANPSSVHADGRAARAILEAARAKVAALAGCEPGEVIFTASGTEANAMAILGRPPGRILVGSLEHASVRLAAARAGELGASAVELPSTSAGIVDVRAARALLAEGASVLAVQLANNETGAIQPVAELAAAAREAGVPLHCDAVQAAGKLPLTDVVDRCESVSISSHKLGGLPGAGALVLRKGMELRPTIPGHQERGRRGGSHSLAAIAAFGAVAELAMREASERRERLEGASRRLEEILLSAGAGIQAAAAPRVPGIVSATFEGVDGETLLVSLDLAGISAAHGAACSTGAMEPSHVLLAMGLSPALARSTLRFSVGPATTDEELDRLEAELPKALRSSRL